MRFPDPTISPERMLYVFGGYHLNRLRADEETVDLANAFGQAQDALRIRLDEHREAEAATMTALAVRDSKDDKLDDAVRVCCFKVLEKVLNNRKDARFLNLFPGGMTPMITEAPEDEVREVLLLAAKLDKETDVELHAQAAPLRAGAEALRQAISDYNGIADREALALSALQDEKRKWIDAYAYSYRQLQLRFYQDPKKAERYFRPARKVSRGGAEEEGESVTEVPEQEAAVKAVAGAASASASAAATQALNVEEV
ncbi:MAG: hypothetical protein ACE15D_13200 [Candidatus Eisenbacteria bacterium]